MEEGVEPGFWQSIKIANALPKREPMGFFTDASLCIGCEACEVASVDVAKRPTEEPMAGTPS